MTYGRDEWWRAAAGLGVLMGLVDTVAFAADSALVAEGKRTRCPVDREMDRGSPTRAGTAGHGRRHMRILIKVG